MQDLEQIEQIDNAVEIQVAIRGRDIPGRTAKMAQHRREVAEPDTETRGREQSTWKKKKRAGISGCTELARQAKYSEPIGVSRAPP